MIKKKYSGVSEPVWLSSVIFLFFKGVACLVNNIVFKRLIVYKALVYHSRVSTFESVYVVTMVPFVCAESLKFESRMHPLINEDLISTTRY